MSMWLYQLNPVDWPPEIFRYEIWEQERWHWGYGQKRGDANPAVGDTIVFFYAPSGGKDPGIYGWAVIERCDLKSGTLYFIPVSPTDHLKMDPWWDKQASKVADEIRGPMKQATLFQVPQAKVSVVRSGIRKWLQSPHEVGS
jgi:hypothetical protein